MITPAPVTGIALASGNGRLLKADGGFVLLASSLAVAADVSVEDYSLPVQTAYAHIARTIVQRPAFFYQAGDPDEGTEPRFYEAWQNHPATLVPVWNVRTRHGIPSGTEYWDVPWIGGIIPPDATGATTPGLIAKLTGTLRDAVVLGGTPSNAVVLGGTLHNTVVITR